MRCLPALSLVVALIALAGVAPVAWTAPAASAATEHRCGAADKGDLLGAQDVRAKGIGCTSARRLARHHSDTSGRDGDCSLAKSSCRLDGYTCRRSFFGNSGTRVRCSKGGKRVRFLYGT
jgi:hypothetical protein